MESPSARIRETKEVLERLQKRLERYYQPNNEGDAVLKHTDLVKDFQTRLHQRRLLELDRPPPEPFSSTELKYSRFSDGKQKHQSLEKPSSLTHLRPEPKELNSRPLDIGLSPKHNEQISRELKQLKKRLEKVQKSHIKKQVKLEKQVDKLKQKLSKSNKLNKLLLKQLSPPKIGTSASSSALNRLHVRNSQQQPLECLKRKLQPPQQRPCTAKRS